MLLVYEGSDDVTVKYSKDDNYCCMLEKHDRANKITNNCNYDADISNCSTDINLSSSMQEDEHSHQEYLNDIDHDHDIGIENDETNMDHCLYDDLPTSSGLGRVSKMGDVKSVPQSSPPESKRMFLEPHNRSVSPHSMDSWICYSNSSDEFSQDCILSKAIKREEALNVGEDTEDVDVYDKINFVTNLNSKYQEGATSSGKENKKSKMNLFDQNETTVKSNISFRFPDKLKLAPETGSDEKDDGIGDEDLDEDDDSDLEEIEDDEQLSSLSSNIDTIIVSENGTAKYFKSSSSNDTDLPNKKNRLSLNTTSNSGTTTVTSTVTSAVCSMATKQSEIVNKVEGNLPPVDVRIIDFAHTTFALKNGGILESKSKSPSIAANSTITAKIHHGPDSGFITGILSLKRILTEIVAEYYQENISNKNA